MRNKDLYILIGVLMLMLMMACQGEEVKLITTNDSNWVEANLQVNVAKVATRGGETETAIGIVPDLTGKLLILMVKDNGDIDHNNVIMPDATQVLYPVSGTPVRVKFDRTVIRYIYVIGNIEQHHLALNETPITNPATENWTATLQGKKIGDIQYMMAEQGEKSGTAIQQLDSRKVNLYGRVPTSGLPQGANNIVIEVRPAISRIEIGGFKAVQRDLSTDSKITSFKLEEIFINNTFEYMGADYVSYPSAWQTNSSAVWSHSSLIAYNWQYARYVSAAAPGSVFKDGSYPVRYKAAVASGTSTAEGANQVLYPSSATTSKHYWSFYVSPAWKKNPDYKKTDPENEDGNYRYLGNKITPFTGDNSHVPGDDDRKFYSAMPMIVCRFSDVTIETASGTPEKPEWFNNDEGSGWLTIFKYKDAKADTIIPNMKPGHVYQIEMIEFADTDIHSQPITETEGGLYGLLSVKGWTDVTVPEGPGLLPIR